MRALLTLLLALLLAPAFLTAAPLPPRRLPVGGQLAVGLDHTLLLRPNGTLYSWGTNLYGQLGTGGMVATMKPVAVAQGAVPAGVRLVQVAAGNSFSLALGSNGLVYAWGLNTYGQLGDGTSGTNRLTPVAVNLPAGVRIVQVAAGGQHSVALAADGTAYSWGLNTYGQLGDGSVIQRLTPVAVAQGAQPTGTRLVQVATGTSYSLALAADGTPYAWGRNNFGQLGDNSATNRSSPVAVRQGALPTGTRLMQLVAGAQHSLALAADGTAYAWGLNTYGQLGDNTTTQRLTPVAVAPGALPTGTPLVQLVAVFFHTLALAADGTAYAWGRDNNGQLGDGTTTDSPVPVAVAQGVQPSGTRLAQLGYGSQANHSLALAASGTPYAWGLGTSGQLGNNGTASSPTPVAPLLPDRAYGYQQAAGGSFHSLGLRADGTAWAWGYNNRGQLGDGTGTTRRTPVAVAQGALPATARLTQVAAGEIHSLALAADGTAYAWGNNGSGRLGDGTTTNRTRPVAVAQGALPATARLTQVAAGEGHSLALAADGTAYAWGDNSSGQLGDGTTTDQTTPVAVAQGALPATARLTQVAAGQYHSLALAADGTAYSWGDNGSGQLGDGTTTNHTSPVAVAQGVLPTTARLVQVAAGDRHSLALAADGTLYAWGENADGQLGDGTYTDRSAPVAVTMPAGVRFVQVSAGNAYSLALAADGTLYGWGRNGNGQLGDGTTSQRLTPVAEASGTVAWTALAAGSLANHSLVLGSGAAVYTAGYNGYGELGDGTTTSSSLFLRNLAPLPVTLVSFVARPAGPATVQLAWATASEKNSAAFEVERSLDGAAFGKVGMVAAAGTSSAHHDYALLDQQLPAGATLLYYRLKQVDADGTFSYSPVRTVTLTGAGGGLSLYPNPARGGAATLTGAAPGTMVTVLDALGRPVTSATANASGTAALVLPAGQPAGVYVVRAGSQALRLVVE